MENDERLMEHTEKLVADMLKYVFAPNGLQVEESVEFVIIDEAGAATTAAANGLEETLKMSTPTSMDQAYNEVLGEVEMLISNGLNKIRMEYPMYPEFTNPYLCNNYWPNTMQHQQQHQQTSYGISANAQTPMHNIWLVGNNTNNHAAFENAYQTHYQRQQNCVGEMWNDEDEWPIVGNLPKRNRKVINTLNENIENHENTDEQSEENEDDDIVDDDDEDSHSNTAIQSQQQKQNHNQNATNNQYAEYSTGNPTSTVTSASAAAANSTPFQLSQTALHQTHSTTTTTTAFGVVHQQTSSTTTNFVSNNLANAALSSTPAALYAQALLAQQYMTAIQQRHINNVSAQPVMHHYNHNHNNNNNNNNFNAAIYERVAYAQLLQQQILQQQQQQAAFAALLQQQKIALQNNIIAAAQAANTNSYAASSSSSNVVGTPNVAAAPAAAAANNHISAGNLSSNSNECIHSSSNSTTNLNLQINSNMLNEEPKCDLAVHNNCVKTNSSPSLDTLTLNVADDERQVATSACQGIVVSKVLQASHD